MRILFLDQFSDLGGGQHALLNTVDAVHGCGWEPYVLLPGHGPLVEALQSRHVPVGQVPCGPYSSGTKSVADHWRFALDLRRQVRVIETLAASARIDLIYVNGPRLLPAAACAAGGRLPIVFHAHSHLRGFALHLTRWALRRAEATVVSCSQSVLNTLQWDGTVIPNGVRDIGYRERNLKPNARIGVIGRIAPEKGQLEFVKAAALLQNKLPLARFVICGAPLFEASSSYFDAVRRQAGGLLVEFIGWQPDVGHVLNDLDLLAVPSHQEGMARIVLEAFSAGVPVLAFPSGGIPEAVIQGVTGFLTRESSASALATCIEEVITADPQRLRQIAWNARKSWEQSYTLGAYQTQITNLLRSLARDRASVPVPECGAAMPLQRK